MLVRISVWWHLFGPQYLLVLDRGHYNLFGEWGGCFSTNPTPANGTFSYFSKHFNYSRDNSTSLGRIPCWGRSLPAFVLISNDWFHLELDVKIIKFGDHLTEGIVKPQWALSAWRTFFFSSTKLIHCQKWQLPLLCSSILLPGFNVMTCSILKRRFLFKGSAYPPKP